MGLDAEENLMAIAQITKLQSVWSAGQAITSVEESDNKNGEEGPGHLKAIEEFEEIRKLILVKAT